MRGLKRQKEKNIAQQAKCNPKAFWSHIRSKLKTKSGIAPLIAKDNTKKYTDLEKANILQDQYSSLFTNEPTFLL